MLKLDEKTLEEELEKALDLLTLNEGDYVDLHMNDGKGFMGIILAKDMDHILMKCDTSYAFQPKYVKIFKAHISYQLPNKKK